jgi:outer membrane immunogenic protein
MLRTFLGVVGVSTLLIGAPIGAASAADMPLKAPPAPVPVMSWTGCYLDGGVGYGLWNQDHSNFNPGFTPTVTVTTTDGGRGWLGRLGGGCDYQTPLFANRLVIGVFGDYDWMGLNGTNQSQLIFAGVPEMSNVKETSAWYVGGRVGYLPYPDLMTFVSGGWTGTRFSESAEFQTLGGAASGFTFPASYTVNGWFLGGGYEYRLPWLNGLFWKTEYRFAQYQATNLQETTLAGVADANTQRNQSYVQTVTSSLVWRFNWH